MKKTRNYGVPSARTSSPNGVMSEGQKRYLRRKDVVLDLRRGRHITRKAQQQGLVRSGYRFYYKGTGFPVDLVV